MAHEFRDGADFKGFALWKGDGAGRAEGGGDVFGFLAIDFEKFAVWIPLLAGAIDNFVSRAAATELLGCCVEKLADADDFREGEGFDFGEGIVEAELVADAALKDFSADGEGTFGSERTGNDFFTVGGEGFLGGVDEGGVGGAWLDFFEERGDGVEQGGGAGGGLFHDFAPDAFGAVNEFGGVGEIAGSLPENGAQISGDKAGFIFTALEFVKEEIQDLI